MSERSWRIYLDAAQRQAQIAALFRGLLLVALADDPAASGKNRPKVETQAYFEGLILAARSAEEKLYEAVCVKEKFSEDDKKKRYDYAQARLKERASEREIKGSFKASKNLRALRNAMTHFAHDKRPGANDWMVYPLCGEENSFPMLSLEKFAEQAYRYAKFLGQLIELYMQE